MGALGHQLETPSRAIAFSETVEIWQLTGSRGITWVKLSRPPAELYQTEVSPFSERYPENAIALKPQGLQSHPHLKCGTVYRLAWPTKADSNFPVL